MRDFGSHPASTRVLGAESRAGAAARIQARSSRSPTLLVLGRASGRVSRGDND